MIVEKATGRAIYYSGDDLWLEDGETQGKVPAPNGGNTWLCAVTSNTFLFFHRRTCRYLGSLETEFEPASLTTASAKEKKETGAFRFFTRAHPQGGHRLLLLDGHSMPRVVAVDKDNSHLHARRHGPTLWEFHKVAGY